MIDSINDFLSEDHRRLEKLLHVLHECKSKDSARATERLAEYLAACTAFPGF
jgi:hypothetical protein